jgi:hypothetical protein
METIAMTHTNIAGPAYFCPMHTDVHAPQPGQCTRCGMDLVPQGTRFALLHHMMSRPLHLFAMVALMAALMAAAMLWMR